jgi:hypothetical protein
VAYDNLLSNVKGDGQIIIGDMQLASGWRALFNPVTLLISRRYGGTREGHEKSAGHLQHPLDMTDK